LRVAHAADDRAFNPFESVLRACAIEAGLQLRPQLEIVSHGLRCTPDLVDPERRLVVEAESFAWHGDRRGLRKDCRRYTLLALGGWRVIRFSWEDVILQPAYVKGCLRELARGTATGVVRPGTPSRAA
jgi:very-short-patch-repair endonuclease